MAPTAPAAARLGQVQMLARGRNSSSRAMCLHPPRARPSAPWCSATMPTASWFMPAGSAPATPQRSPRTSTDELERIRAPASPFAERLGSDAARQVRYVKPELVAEVEFRAWTADHILRHAAFRGLREDKPATEVVREAATGDRRASPASLSQADPSRPDLLARRGRHQGRTWRTTTPRSGATWRPSLSADRLALVRCPHGITGQCFFQKHAWQGLSRSIQITPDPKDSSAALLAINDLDGLIGLVQAGVLEIHPWGASLSRFGAAGHHHHGSRSGRGGELAGGRSPPRSRCGTGLPLGEWRVSSRPRAARACTSWRRCSRRPIGRR